MTPAQPTPASLPAIAALARGGAHERAWELFVAAGHDRRGDDPAALSLRGRLLKERARHGSGRARLQAMREAAAAYDAANAIEPAAWLAINVATLRLLAGETDALPAAAMAVLTLLDDPCASADTPYHRAAIRAEALLLLGDQAAARAAMREAANADPDGWDDRAVTVRQLTAICTATGLPLTWLDEFRPPASLHYAGHMALVPGGPGEVSLAARIDEIVAVDRIGFGFGTAAAGSDIVIAERILGAGGELVLVLPCEPGLFERQSVAPAGQGWSARYQALLKLAQGVIVARPGGSVGGRDDLHDPLATQLAGRMAIGEALLHADHFATTACQAIAFDPAGGGAHSRDLAEQWPIRSTQRSLRIARETEVRSIFAGAIDDPARRLASVVSIAIDLSGLDSGGTRIACQPVWKALSRIDPARIVADHRGWDVLCEEPAEAADLALGVLAAARSADVPPPSVGLASGIVAAQRDDISGHWIARGPVTPAARRMARQAVAGTTCATTAFALLLAAQGRPGPRCELLHTGEGGADDAVYRVLAAD